MKKYTFTANEVIVTVFARCLVDAWVQLNSKVKVAATMGMDLDFADKWEVTEI